jgi:ribonuclease VapC
VTIAVDTSALVAIVLGEPDAEAYLSILSSNAGDIEMSAATHVEASIVVTARQGSEADDDLTKLLSLLEIDVTPVDREQARAAIAAWRRFGKGHHPAALNFGDCFSYALAKTRGTALLYKGDDFMQTDVASAL